jgi:hypothetical protein
VDKLRDALVQIVLRLREEVLKDRADSRNSDRDDKLTVATTDPYASSLSLPTLLPYSQEVSPMGYDRRRETERDLDVFPRSRSYGYSSLQVHICELTLYFIFSLLVLAHSLILWICCVILILISSIRLQMKTMEAVCHIHQRLMKGMVRLWFN